MPELFPIGLQDQIACVAREIKMRKKVYPRWVGQGNMTQETADREIAVMTEVLGTLNRLEQQAQQDARDSRYHATL